MSYDQKCYDLAAAFLSDHADKNTEANRDQLAQLIQRTIEDDIEFGMMPPSTVQECPSCKLPYKNGDTCPAIRGGCPMGGDF